MPFFGVSWFAFFAALATVNGLGWFNSWLIAHREAFNVEAGFPIPDRMFWILLDALLLVSGSTMYRIACPERIQEFSEIQWVEEREKARIQYWAESWSKLGWSVTTLILLALGAVIAFVLVVERVGHAFWYMILERK
jgi:hypothetical protein